MRGKEGSISADHFGIRITPAYAGKSAHILARTTECEDHPRVCGEKHLKYRLRNSTTGSPPRMRGKVHLRSDLK